MDLQQVFRTVVLQNAGNKKNKSRDTYINLQFLTAAEVEAISGGVFLASVRGIDLK